MNRFNDEMAKSLELIAARLRRSRNEVQVTLNYTGGDAIQAEDKTTGKVYMFESGDYVIDISVQGLRPERDELISQCRHSAKENGVDPDNLQFEL